MHPLRTSARPPACTRTDASTAHCCFAWLSGQDRRRPINGAPNVRVRPPDAVFNAQDDVPITVDDLVHVYGKRVLLMSYDDLGPNMTSLMFRHSQLCSLDEPTYRWGGGVGDGTRPDQVQRNHSRWMTGTAHWPRRRRMESAAAVINMSVAQCARMCIPYIRALGVNVRGLNVHLSALTSPTSPRLESNI